MDVRGFELADAEEVLRLYRSAGDWFEDIKVTKEFIISSSERQDFRFIVAEEGGALIGFAGALYFTAVGRAELGPIGVEEGMRRKGVGGRLTESMIGFLKDSGIKRVTVKVKADNKVALGFFMGRGFSVESYLRRYTLKGEDVLELSAII